MFVTIYYSYARLFSSSIFLIVLITNGQTGKLGYKRAQLVIHRRQEILHDFPANKSDAHHACSSPSLSPQQYLQSSHSLNCSQ